MFGGTIGTIRVTYFVDILCAIDLYELKVNDHYHFGALCMIVLWECLGACADGDDV